MLVMARNALKTMFPAVFGNSHVYVQILIGFGLSLKIVAKIIKKSAIKYVGINRK